MKPSNALLPSVGPALLADATALLALFFLFPALSQRLATPGGGNALLLSAGFLVFCGGVYILRRLQPVEGGGEWASRHWRAALAVALAFVVSLALAWQLGFFRSGLQVDTRDLGEGGSASYFVYGPGAWLAFSMLYVLVLAFTVRPTVAPAAGRRPAVATVGLLAAHVLLLLLSAQARAVVGGSAGWLPAIYPLLLLLFVPPRLLYIARATIFPSPAAYILLGLFLTIAGAYALGIIS